MLEEPLPWLPMSKPDERTADCLRKDGWVGGRVEQWIPRPVKVPDGSLRGLTLFELKIRRDFLGAIDSMWYRDLETLAVQSTSNQTGGNMGARIHKALHEAPALLDFLVLGSNRRFQVWAWRQLRTEGNRWRSKVAELVRTETGVVVVECPDMPVPRAKSRKSSSSLPAGESSALASPAGGPLFR